MSDRQEHIRRTVYSLHSAIDDLALHVAHIGEHDARDMDAARMRLELLYNKLRFKVLQAAE